MIISKTLTITSILLLIFNHGAECQELTEDGRFGCVWQGGSITRLLCNCNRDAEMTIKSDSITSISATEISVNGCKTTRIEENAVAALRNLRIITLRNIDAIFFESRSISWYGYKDNNQRIEEERFDVSVPSLSVYVYNSNISQVSNHAFAGRISKITFENVVMDKVEPLGFSNLLQTETVTIRNTVFKDIGPQSFKKFSTENLELSGVTAELIPSRTFSNITVYQNVTINNCDFGTIRSGGFTIYNPKLFQVTNTTIKQLNGEAFKIISRGVILFRDNSFGAVDDGAFAGIVLRKDVFLGETAFKLDSNRISTLSPLGLKMSEPGVELRRILFNEPCDCTIIDDKIKDSSYYDEILCMNDNQLVAMKNFKANMCSVVSNLYMIIIIVSVVIILIVAILVGLFLYYKFVYKSAKYGDKKNTKNGNMSLIVPDGRTYRETELHVIVERTDLLTTDL